MAMTTAQTAIGAEGKSTGRPSPSTAATGKTMGMIESHCAWPMISRLPTMLAVNIPLRRFRVCDLLNLERGQTVESEWAATQDVPLKTGELQLGWGEFEVIERSMALRLTRLA